MGYFSNGSEGAYFHDKYCSRCRHMPEDPNDGNCPIMLAHSLYNYEQHKNADVNAVLDMLIAEKENFRQVCQMFVERPTTPLLDLTINERDGAK